MPITGAESWTVLGDDGGVVAPVERYLAYLGALERSPNMVRANAVSLGLWFEFLGQAGVGWADAGVEDVARFVAWLRAPAGNVIVLETGPGRRSPVAGPMGPVLVVMPFIPGQHLAQVTLVVDQDLVCALAPYAAYPAGRGSGLKAGLCVLARTRTWWPGTRTAGTDRPWVGP